jgi:hypothetical protein
VNGSNWKKHVDESYSDVEGTGAGVDFFYVFTPRRDGEGIAVMSEYVSNSGHVHSADDVLEHFGEDETDRIAAGNRLIACGLLSDPLLTEPQLAEGGGGTVFAPCDRAAQARDELYDLRAASLAIDSAKEAALLAAAQDTPEFYLHYNHVFRIRSWDRTGPDRTPTWSKATVIKVPDSDRPGRFKVAMLEFDQDVAASFLYERGGNVAADLLQLRSAFQDD